MKKQTTAWTLATLTLLVIIAVVIPFIYSEPVGVSILYNNSSTAAIVNTSRADDGGTITILNLNADQQNDGWKGYVGNVTGKFTLDDSDGYSIYDWTFTITVGEVYITRASSPTWSGAECAGTTVITAEETYFNMLPAQADEITDTFNETIHANFRVGSINITNSTCPSTFTYQNDTRPTTRNESIPFQEVLLQMNGTSDDLVYVSLLETDAMGYNVNRTFDFQAIIPDNTTFDGMTIYYFFAELGY